MVHGIHSGSAQCTQRQEKPESLLLSPPASRMVDPCTRGPDCQKQLCLALAASVTRARYFPFINSHFCHLYNGKKNPDLLC